MTIKVLFFGATAEAVSSRDLNVEIMGGENAGSLIKRLKEEYPRLENHRLLISVNQQYGSVNIELNDGDEVAIFTAVSGG